MYSFQDITFRLSQFWAEKGCILHQGHDLEVGAGTFNPVTFLKALGPEPYNAVYVEPSRRPQDGRYGKNPNRLQLFHQLQVIMKPMPTNIKETYLESLEYIGFDLDKHDIRFVHDDWESPTLGAWGLGWEVWIDGMEVTQFTYFQSVAGFNLNPISAEITYGLERITLLAQGAKDFFEMKYNSKLTYGDIYKHNEYEWSTYNFEEANTEMWLKHFEDYEREAKTMIELNLPTPAYDFVIKASHAFNILEARGTLSTTERTGYIHRIRDLARLTAVEYLSVRESLSHPLGKASLQHKIEIPTLSEVSFDSNTTDSLLIEIGVEQLPATFVSIGMKGLKQGVQAILKKENIACGEIKIYGTPQRLTVYCKDVALGTKDEKTERRGPLVEVAFDSSGTLTKQGKGFISSLGLEDISLQNVKEGKVESLRINDGYLYAIIHKTGQSLVSILQQTLGTMIASIKFPKSMKWTGSPITFARPIKWLVALIGTEVIPFSLGSIQSGNMTFGHAQLDKKQHEISHPDNYLTILKDAFVIADVEERRQLIEGQLSKIEKEQSAKSIKRERVLEEVLQLTEWPSLGVCSFNESFKKCPKELLVSEMVEHQRYFPLEDSSGEILPMCVITADTNISDLILKNNVAVLTARLSDGVFLYEQDLKTGLEGFNKLLSAITFHKDLGSIADKVKRLESNILVIAEMLGIEDTKTALRAAHLCKADLSSNLVGEFPELQGTIGKYYALAENESDIVASAIEEHWLPNKEKGPLPESEIGKILSISDKLDNILSYFSVGIKPSSSKDPYALRRQTLGIIKILIDSEWSIDLQEVFSKIIKTPSIVKEALTFFNSRMKTALEEYGFRKDEIESALTPNEIDPYDAYLKVKALNQFKKGSKDFSDLFEVYKRAKGQLTQDVKSPFSELLLEEEAEKKLFASLSEMNDPFLSAIEIRDYSKSFELLATLKNPLAHLFDHVKILHEDLEIRNNRIALLKMVFSNFSKLLDFSKIQM